MLAFMNITTDDPTLSSFQQIVASAYKDGTQMYARTWDSGMTINFVVPTQAEGGIIGDHSISTTQVLVAPVDAVITKLGLFVVGSDSLSLQLTKSVQASTDGYMALPLTTTSTSFYIASYTPYPGSHSTFAVAALEDSTCIEIFAVNGSESTRIDFVSLNSFEVYNGLSDEIDFTGYMVLSTHPVTVLGGHMCAQVPVGIMFCDHLSSQMPPLDEWGTDFIVPGIRGRLNTAGYIMRVLASEDDTEVFINNAKVATISRGIQYFEYEAEFTYEILVIRCSAPCLVIQYNVGYLYEDGGNAATSEDKKRTDPYMMIVPSLDHYQTTLRFGTSNFIADELVEEFENHLAIVAPTSKKGSVTLNLEYLPTDTVWIDMSNGYSVCNFEIEHGLYNIRSNTGDVPLMCFIYGHGRTHITAYGYPGGFHSMYNMVNPLKFCLF